MALTPGEKQLLKVGLQALHDKHAFKDNLARELEADSVRRRRVATKFRRGIMKAAFKAAGIDSEEIARRQEKENRSVLARIRALNPQVSKNARIIAKRQKDQVFLIKEFAKRLPVPRHRGPNPPGQAPEGTLLTQSDNTSFTYDDGQGTLVTTEPYKNTLRTSLAFLGDANLAVSCNFSFMYTPSRSGALHAWSWVTCNGSYGWSTEQTCWDSASSSCSIGASVVLQQIGPTGILNQVSIMLQHLGTVEKDFQQDHHCEGDSGFSVFDELAAFESPMDLPVIGGTPVQIIVSVGANVQGSNGFGDLDLTSSGRNLNVLGVALILY